MNNEMWQVTCTYFSLLLIPVIITGIVSIIKKDVSCMIFPLGLLGASVAFVAIIAIMTGVSAFWGYVFSG